MLLSRGDYGFDAPHIPIGLAIAAVLAGGIAAILFASSWPWLAGFSLAIAVVFALSTISFVWTTRRGKFIVWDELLNGPIPATPRKAVPGNSNRRSHRW